MFVWKVLPIYLKSIVICDCYKRFIDACETLHVMIIVRFIATFHDFCGI